MYQFKGETDVLTLKLKKAEDSIPYVVSRALNDVAFKARKDIAPYLSAKIDNPVPFTLRGTLVQQSSKQNLRAIVYLREEVARYLEPLIEGGERSFKGPEVGIKATPWYKFFASSDTAYFVPATHLRTGRGGNITKGKARKIVQEIRKKNGRFFLWQDDTNGRTHIMERVNKNEIRLALFGLDNVKYREQIDYVGKLEDLVKRSYAKALERRLDDLLPPSDVK